MLPIIHEGRHWMAIQKPAGLTVEQGAGDYDTVESLLRTQLHPRGFIGFPHRLDRPTSGILLIAQNKNTLRLLNQQFAGGHLQKHYLMLTQKGDLPKAQTLTHWLRKDQQQRKALITQQSEVKAKEAKLWFRQLRKAPQNQTLLQVRLFTGRYHQIRAQMAHIGSPVVNDTWYGGPKVSPTPCIALHAWRLEFTDPHSGKAVRLQAPLPANDCWPQIWHEKSIEEIG